MRSKIYLPREVHESIHRHIKRAVKRALGAHGSGEEDEDTLTGQLGAYLRTPRPRSVAVQAEQGSGTWTWRIDYRKFRGRGPKATERTLGADGIFELVVTHAGDQARKASLFQAKTHSDDRMRLLAQLIRLSTWKEAAFVVHYRDDGYTAMDFDSAFSLANNSPAVSDAPLDAFIMEWFVACLVGDSELCYHGEDRVLSWRDLTGERVEASFAVKHQLNLRVDAPLPGSNRFARRIDPDSVHDHRMEAADEEILGIGPHARMADLKRAKRAAAKKYHTDRYQQLEAGDRYILDLRLKETNTAAERVAMRLMPERAQESRENGPSAEENNQSHRPKSNTQRRSRVK